MKTSTLLKTPSRIAMIAGFAATLAACQTTREVIETTPEQQDAYLAAFPLSLHENFRPVLTEGPQNEVQHYMNAGTLAFEMGEFDTATIAFDRALLRIETFYADNEIAEQARSNFTPEDYKDFRGEPHERMMVYYYRGLLYMRDGDFENARASFRSGLLQDSFTLEEEFAQDSALMAYLIGWTSRCNGDQVSAEDGFAEALEYRPGLKLPAEGDNILALAEIGFGPDKIALGEYDQFLTLIPDNTYPEQTAYFKIGDTHVPTYELEDIAYQATTRGGREVDVLLQGKAQFKENTDLAGDALMAAGAVALTTDDESGGAAIAGGIMLLAGVISKGISAATTAEADTRTWHNLPGEIHFMTLNSADVDLNSDIPVFFTDEYDVVKTPLTTTAHVFGPESCQVLWATSRSKSYEDADEPLF